MKSFIKHYKLQIIIIFLGLLSLPIIIFAVDNARNNYRLYASPDIVYFKPVISDHLTTLTGTNIYTDVGICFINTGDRDYYIPNNTVAEWTSWMNAITSNTVSEARIYPGVCNNGYCQTSLQEDCTNSTDCGTCAVPPPTYRVLYNAEAHGTLLGTIKQDIAPGGHGTPVEAVPDQNYVFDRWGGTPVGDPYANPRVDANVNEARGIIAEFAPFLGDGVCGPSFPQYCEGGVYQPYGAPDPVTGEPPSGGPDDPCSYGYCASQCGWYCPSGYYDPSGWVLL